MKYNIMKYKHKGIKAAMNSLRNVMICMSQVSISGLQAVRRFDLDYITFVFCSHAHYLVGYCPNICSGSCISETPTTYL